MTMNSLESVTGSVTAQAPVAPVSTVSTNGWVDSLKERFSTQEPWAVELVIFGLGGFLAGFLVKNFGRLALLALVIAAAVVVGLHYTQVTSVPFEKVQEFLGISDLATFQEVLNAKISWCFGHPVASVSAIVGFFVGWKVG